MWVANRRVAKSEEFLVQTAACLVPVPTHFNVLQLNGFVCSKLDYEVSLSAPQKLGTVSHTKQSALFLSFCCVALASVFHIFSITIKTHAHTQQQQQMVYIQISEYLWRAIIIMALVRICFELGDRVARQHQHQHHHSAFSSYSRILSHCITIC